MIKSIISLFPIWAALAALVAYFQPALVADYASLVVPLLVIIMFCMGVTLTISDFKRVAQNPKVIAITVFLQFLIMPLAAFIIAKVLGLSTELLVGMLLVGAVSGGTASNVMAYLAKADVALSISMTVVSTLLSVIATPYLALLYLGETVPVPAVDMLISILKMVFVPVVLGVIINYFLHNQIEKIKDIFALISIVAIVMIIAIVVGANHAKIISVGLLLIFAVILHNLAGLTGGYYVAKLLGYDRKICKTVAIEVGMQNSGLAVTLAMKFFTPISALPGAIFSVWHNISGSLLAGYWAKKDK